MTPQEFVEKWASSPLGEKQIAQAHFLDVCRLVGVEMPGGIGMTQRGDTFVFEQSLKGATGYGFADVYYENHFAVEYKSPDKYKDLNAAYEQLQRYRENLKNPPLLVVTDINHWEIHTNYPNTEKRVYRFGHSEIAADNEVLGWLRAMFHAPERLHPGRNTEQITKDAADAFKLIADNMRDWDAAPTRIAYFLTKLVFCLFAEDVGLLPTIAGEPQGVFSYIIEHSRGKPNVFKQYVQNLFVAMNEGGNLFMRDIPYFNGTLFNVVTVETLQPNAIEELSKAAKLNWASIEPSIFGTLFERSLDPNKRSQRGAHYTSRDDILLIVEPVLMQPLRYAWDTVQLEAATIRERYDNAGTGRAKSNARKQLLAKRDEILARIRGTTVLDPACGSGNFLYVSLQMLMDLEKEVVHHPLWAGLQMATREVHPRQMFGIEIDPIAHALASIVVWIGYIQWRISNGYGQEFGEPILEELEDNIVCHDAILAFDEAGQPTEPAWPKVDVIVGNPPFLGGKKQRRELGDEYIDRLLASFPHIHGEADLSTYWFEKSRHQVKRGQAQRVGLLSTNSIRAVRSRTVLDRIKEMGDIFMAWSDREWILDGAAVRVSMIGFDDGSETAKTLDGKVVNEINPDLTGADYISAALRLPENKGISFMGLSPTGDFPISNDLAQKMLLANNQNSEVLRRFISGKDLASRDRMNWIVDFTGLDLQQAAQYELPMQYLLAHVKPYRDSHRNAKLRDNWWLFEAARTGMVNALRGKSRQLMTSLTAKHRFFIWYPSEARAANTVVVIARDDDYMFGMLHSQIHVVWALRKGATLEDRPRYNNSTTFETFPFPWPPGAEDLSHPAHARISAAAAQLHQERDAWLNPGLSPHPPAPSPKMREGELGIGELAKSDESPLPLHGGEGLGVGEKWHISPALERRMQVVARELRKNPTPSEDKLWQAIRKKQLDGRKFRRQVAIGAFVVDFYCSSERLVVEVDGPVHEEQREADQIRQGLIESLGIHFVRLSNDEVENSLESSLSKIRQAFRIHEPARSDESPLPLHGGGGLGVGEKALKDRTLTNLYNALAVFRGRDSMKTKPAAADFAPRLDQLHRELDQAVCDAYGWEDAILDDEEEILRRLLALNLERAASQ